MSNPQTFFNKHRSTARSRRDKAIAQYQTADKALGEARVCGKTPYCTVTLDGKNKLVDLTIDIPSPLFCREKAKLLEEHLLTACQSAWSENAKAQQEIIKEISAETIIPKP